MHAPGDNAAGGLTARDLEILALIGTGLLYRTVARRMHITYHQVDYAARCARRVYGTSWTLHAARIARASGHL